jgi:hypothetical protein
MGRDLWRARQNNFEREERKRIHPAWRGVGCLLMSVLAIGGYLFSNWFLVNNNTYGWVYLPPEVIRPSFVPWMPPGALVSLVVGFFFLIFAYLFVSIAYSIVFPTKRGEFDVPPLKRERRRKT